MELAIGPAAGKIKSEATSKTIGFTGKPGSVNIFVRLGSRLTVGQWTLDPFIGVRIPAPQLS